MGMRTFFQSGDTSVAVARDGGNERQDNADEEKHNIFVRNDPTRILLLLSTHR